jgi:pyridoxamine 5'-phosphate oxidase family protein
MMSAFTPAEINYLPSQFLGRLATVGSDGRPHVVPVGFRYNPEHDMVDIGGHDFARRKKFRDVRRNRHVAFVVDDVASVTPWRARGIEIRGKTGEHLMSRNSSVTFLRFFIVNDGKLPTLCQCVVNVVS